MKLSIITINLNNTEGLRKTMDSVLSQTFTDFEYVVVDGNSTDGSVELIKKINNSSDINSFLWVSEPDSGIYNAMNKGISMAKGEYIQFLNSGDILAANNVTERMLDSLPNDCNIFYGNMLKSLPKRIHRDKGFAGRQPTMLDFYTGTLNHSSAYIKRSLFDTYGLYDESLKIVSDWKWYLQVIVLNDVIPVYTDIDVTVFDMNGISNINSLLEKQERMKVLKELLPRSILLDYDLYSTDINRSMRINRCKIARHSIWLIERILFKLEKNKNNK